MRALWLLPLLVTLVGLVPLISAVRSTAEEADRLRRELARMAGLRPAVVELREASRRLGAAVEGMRRA